VRLGRVPPRDLGALALLLVLPAIAYAPAWLEGRLLGPGDGFALHYPLRAEVWACWRRGELPLWNPWIFSGTPLLAAYRPGALHPLMPPLALLTSFDAFQLLVLVSLGATAALGYLYVRRLGAGRVGAYVAGLGFALGPYLVGHLGDTATVVAAPSLLLLLLAAEALLARPARASVAWLALALASLLLAGSPEAARAGGALLVGRLGVALASGGDGRDRSLRGFGLAVLAGALLAAPQLLPTLHALREAGRQATGLAPTEASLPGLTGLVLRYVSHTPAAALAAAALPLWRTVPAIRVLGLSLALCLALQWGRGPLSSPGALALVFDLALAVLAGLSLDAQWRERREPRGARLRLLFLVAALLSAAALSVAAAALGPLPETLAGAVGVLALALILYFSLAADADPIKAHVFLLPLTVSFLLQPDGRGLLAGAPRRRELVAGNSTRQAVDGALAARPGERVLTLVRQWPPEALDLGYAARGGRRSANGYDPMVPLRSRAAYDGMSPSGLLPGAFLRSDPRRLELQGVRYVQLPGSALVANPDAQGLGETLDVVLEPGRPRFFPLRAAYASSLRLATHLANAVTVGGGQRVARLEVRLASGRSLPLELLAGRDTAEWSYDRADVRGAVRHPRATVLESWSERGFLGHRYLAELPLPGRYLVDGVRIEALPGAGLLTLSRMSMADAVGGRIQPFALAAAFVSDMSVFQELLAIPGVRLYELPMSPGRARVVARLVEVADDAAALQALKAPLLAGVAPRSEALVPRGEVGGRASPARAHPAAAIVARAEGARVDVRAEGPGVLVLAEGYDPGWSAAVDGVAARVLRVNHAQLGVALPAGSHRVTLRYRPRGLSLGIAFAALGFLVLASSERVLASPARPPSPA
jgi:hypothetical protein